MKALCAGAGALGARATRGCGRVTLARSALVVAGLLIGLALGGLPGALVGQGLGNLAAYPVLVWLLRPHGAWDPGLDAGFLLVAACLGALALWAAGGLGGAGLG